MMDLTMSQLHAALDALTTSGDSHDIESPEGGTYTVTLTFEPDIDADITDYDCYGKASRYAYQYTGRDARSERPDDFDGSARKIEVDRGLWRWWQPADDMKSRKAWVANGGDPEAYAEAFEMHVSLATDLMRGGFHIIRLDLHETLVDGLGHEHVVPISTYTVGGCDSTNPVFVRDIISDGLAELEAPWDEPNPSEGREA